LVCLVPYVKGDVFKVAYREGDTFDSFAVDHPKTVGTTLKKNGKILGCAGFVMECDGVATFWGFFSEECRGHGVMIFKASCQKIKDFMSTNNIRRLQATCRTDRPEYNRFITMLGFSFEGCLRNAAPNGNDINIYSRIRQCKQCQ